LYQLIFLLQVDSRGADRAANLRYGVFYRFGGCFVSSSEHSGKDAPPCNHDDEYQNDGQKDFFVVLRLHGSLASHHSISSAFKTSARVRPASPDAEKWLGPTGSLCSRSIREGVAAVYRPALSPPLSWV